MTMYVEKKRLQGRMTHCKKGQFYRRIKGIIEWETSAKKYLTPHSQLGRDRNGV